MNMSRIMKSAAAAALAVACVVGVAACSSSEGSSSSGDVAATVNGTEIAEETITTYIESFRTQYSLEEDDAWAEWLDEYGYTIESVREEIIQYYAERELILEECDEQGITVETSEIDEYVDYMVEQLGSQTQWESALEEAGMTEDEYREELEVQMLDAKLQETFATEDDVTDEDRLTYAQMYAESYDGAKRSSHILFDEDDEDTAQEVLDMINDGEISFEDAAAEYSTDSSAEDGGDVGWDKMSSFVDEYQEALDELDEGEVSELVTSDYGIHIIMCTEVYNAPTATDDEGEEVVTISSFDDIPEDWQETIDESLLTTAQEEAYDAWLEEAYSEADVVINDMPDGLSYYVDLSAYADDDDEDTDDEESDDSDADEEEDDSGEEESEADEE